MKLTWIKALQHPISHASCPIQLAPCIARQQPETRLFHCNWAGAIFHWRADLDSSCWLCSWHRIPPGTKPIGATCICTENEFPQEFCEHAENDSSNVLSCIRASVNTGPACVRAKKSFPTNFPACIGFRRVLPGEGQKVPQSPKPRKSNEKVAKKRLWGSTRK